MPGVYRELGVSLEKKNVGPITTIVNASQCCAVLSTLHNFFYSHETQFRNRKETVIIVTYKSKVIPPNLCDRVTVVDIMFLVVTAMDSHDASHVGFYF